VAQAEIIIPFRDRGVDPLRKANLDRVIAHWDLYPQFGVHVVDDGRTGGAHFNRHAAYNRGTDKAHADVLVYLESDILIDPAQIRAAVDLAAAEPGLVIPFSHQHKLSPTDSELVRGWLKEPADCVPDQVIDTAAGGINHGCANVISRATLRAVGRWDDRFEGHGHDDTAMRIAFDRCAGPIRHVMGVAYHLYHLDFDPTLTRGAHITAADAAAQDRNLARLELYRGAATQADIRRLTGGWAPQTNWRSRFIENDPRAGRYQA
jgi:glycosyltransferase involved in cell wall biosynthesis